MKKSNVKNVVIDRIVREVEGSGNLNRARVSQRFFKTGPGEYGAGDVFIGMSVPQMRQLAKKYKSLDLKSICFLIESPIHELRFIALAILVLKYENSDAEAKKIIFNFYVKYRKFINNWDLVDTSAPYIVGDYLFNKNKTLLYKLARSKNIWERRVAILATFNFIRRGEVKYTLEIAKLLLADKHDLIHKAVGWMLREVGKKSVLAEEKFLNLNYKQMPRTMLRYAIERLPEHRRLAYLAGKVIA